ncbi:IMP dehydrogenase, partial [Bacillus tropicus]
GDEDTITVSELKTGDVVRVYEASKGGEAIATSKAVADKETEATIKKADLLKTTGGTVYVSVQGVNELESTRTAVKYESQITVAPIAEKITVLNNDGAADIVRVTGLTAGDKVSVYNEETVEEAIGTATVAENKTAVNVVIPQLGEAAGKIYVSVTKVNKDESKRVVINYIAE